MRIGVNTVDEFGGALEAYRRADMHSLSLVEMVKRMHEQLQPEVVEINANVCSIAPQLVTEETLQALGHYQRQTGLQYTVHLPFKVIDISSPSEPVARASAQYFGELIRSFDQHVRVENYVLHLTESQDRAVKHSSMPQGMKDRLLQTMQDRARRGVEYLLAICEPKRLAIENLLEDYLFPFSVAEEFDTSICCDVGHLILQNAELLDVFGRYLPRIGELHYHDVMTVRDDAGHWVEKDHGALGMGPLNVPETLGFLKEHSYEGILMLEVVRWDYAVTSMDKVRQTLKAL